MTNSDNNLIFDRLVDGELSPLERRELLSSLDGRLDGWRQCALAFLEAQTWRGEFNSWVNQANFSDRNVVASTLASVSLTRGARWLQGSLALAATALLAFGVGWNMNAPETAAPTDHEIIVNDPPALQRLADPRDTVTLVVQNERGMPQRLRLPLVDAGQLGDQWSDLSPEIPVDLRADLRDRGYDVKSKQRFAPLFFEQNKRLVPMVVPVNDTYVVPIENPVY